MFPRTSLSDALICQLLLTFVNLSQTCKLSLSPLHPVSTFKRIDLSEKSFIWSLLVVLEYQPQKEMI